MYDHKYLQEFTTELFMRIGCSREDAGAVASVLIAAELRGHSSHGMIRIKEYYDLWKTGRVNVTPDVKVVHQTPSTAVIDGDRCFGMMAGVRSMKLAIEKAADHRYRVGGNKKLKPLRDCRVLCHDGS